MSRDLMHGTWHRISSKADFDSVQSGCRVKRGTYSGPGKYWEMVYQKRCPRNCCYDSVSEMLSAKEVLEECKEAAVSLANMMREARS